MSAGADNQEVGADIACQPAQTPVDRRREHAGELDGHFRGLALALKHLACLLAGACGVEVPIAGSLDQHDVGQG
jgi:predicted exporter